MDTHASVGWEDPSSFSCGYWQTVIGGSEIQEAWEQISHVKSGLFPCSLSLGPWIHWTMDSHCDCPFFHQCTHKTFWFLPSFIVAIPSELWFFHGCIPAHAIHTWVILPFCLSPFTVFAVYIASPIKLYQVCKNRTEKILQDSVNSGMIKWQPI